MKFCDLHLHSMYSDGSDTPRRVAELARTAGLSAAVLTDHNCFDGCDEFFAACVRLGLDTCRGVEISCEESKELLPGVKDDIHLVALFVGEACAEDLEKEFLIPFRQSKDESNRQLAARLSTLVPIDYEAMLAERRDRSVPNRSAFARKLVAAGLVSNMKEAFTKYLDPGLGYYVPALRPRFRDVMSMIRDYGGVPVIAHPFHTFYPDTVRDSLITARKLGALAVEACYSEHVPEQTEYLCELAHELGLLPSGGSDYHGFSVKPGISVGTGRGDLRVPYDHFLRLRELSR